MYSAQLRKTMGGEGPKKNPPLKICHNYETWYSYTFPKENNI